MLPCPFPTTIAITPRTPPQFNGISTSCGLLNAKPILIEEKQRYFLTTAGGDKEVHTFLKGISPKVTIIAGLEFELSFNQIAVQLVSHYASGTPPISLFSLISLFNGISTSRGLLGHSLRGGFYPLSRVAVGVFYSETMLNSIFVEEQKG